jgi:DNA processing protein
MPTTFEIDPLALLTLYSVPRIGPQRIRNLISRFKSPQAVLSASPRVLCEVEGIEKNLAYQIKKSANLDFAKDQLEKIKKNDARLLSYWDPNYPKALKNTPDPPVVLFVKGNIKVLNTPALAIVGTRNPSEYGKITTKHLTGDLAASGLTITSGLARGLDTIAHIEALASGGTTISVLGTGVDVVYPAENKALANKIINQGILISEFPMGDGPDAPHFPRRNRIISGLSLATLVVEAGKKSGALITADFALDHGRDVFVVPGNINNPKCFGSNALIQQGANVVLSAEDILSQLNISGPQKNIPVINLSKDEEGIFNILSHEPKHIDAISQESQKATSFVLATLLSLELKNVVLQMPGKMFAKL